MLLLEYSFFYSTVRIWDYTQDACINILSGHSAPVRGLLWNTEIPYLLISGSWDYTIKVWDTRDGTCLDTVYDHGADVYGKQPICFKTFIQDYIKNKIKSRYVTDGLANCLSFRINLSP